MWSTCPRRSPAHALYLMSALALLFHPDSPIAMSATPPPDSPTPGVSRELARQRAAEISDIRYQLNLNLKPKAERLSGLEEIKFRLTRPTDRIILDFRELRTDGKLIDGTTRDVRANGKPAEDLRQVNGHVLLPGRSFIIGENTIDLRFEARIAAANSPLTRYVDKDDGSEYLYTLFVPMDASMAFPCFDQPDLKARFTLIASAPRDWTVVSNACEQMSVVNGGTETRFEETKPIPTYLFAFAAGPFGTLYGGEDRLAMRLLFRKSKLQRAAEEWPEVLRLTREGMKHQIDFFAQPFPFPKYDQVLIPGFAYGGMEHAGATFLREESILFRTVPTATDKVRRASLVLHELSHQWFGDFVTMSWFDDLWLKEGFAEYMAYHTLAALSPPGEVWKRFYQSHKPAAYAIDVTPGTTPIYQEVPNLKDAKSAYGAIVYRKAPSVLRALAFLIGEEKFRDGIRLFLREHAYANAEWRDLIRAFERAAGRPLDGWADAWVRRRGMPRVDTAWSCDANGKLGSLTLRQHDVLGASGVWPIRTQILFAYDHDPPERITAELNGPSADVPGTQGRKCPAYVFANDGDHAYGLFLLDERSRGAVVERIGGVVDPFLRTMLWGALWDAVRQAQMAPQEYLDLGLRCLPAEMDEELAQTVLANAAHAFQHYLSPSQQAAIAPRLEALCFERMMKAPDQGLRITYYRAFRGVATTAEARGQLKALLAGKLAIPGVPLKPLDRWQIVTALLAQHDLEAEALLAIERRRDQTDDGGKFAYGAEAARPDTETKQRYFHDYLHNPSVPESWVEGSLGGFNAWNQSALTRPYLAPSLAALPQVKRERKIFFVLAWLNAFIGGQQSPPALAEVQAFLRDGHLDRDLELKVREVADELERIIRIRAKYGQAPGQRP